MNSVEAHERLMENQEFWDMFLPQFCDEETVREYDHRTVRAAHTSRKRKVP
jgi:hypothetical protein